jgi:hypothetical protein
VRRGRAEQEQDQGATEIREDLGRAGARAPAVRGAGRSAASRRRRTLRGRDYGRRRRLLVEWRHGAAPRTRKSAAVTSPIQGMVGADAEIGGIA